MESTRLSTVNSDVCFIIQKFLSGGPFAKTLQAFNEEIENNKIFSKRLDWEGKKHDRSVDDMIKQFPHIRPDYLLYLTSRNSISSLLSFPANVRHESGALTNVRQLLCYVIRRNSTPQQDMTSDFNIVNILRGREIAGSISKQRSITPKIYNSFQSQRLTIGHLSAVYCILFDRSGKYIITGADDFLVKVWSTYSGRLIFSFRGSISELTDIAINVENTMIATGSLDRILRVWNLQTGAPVAVLMGHTGMITSVNFCPTPSWDVRYLISTSTDGSLAFWPYFYDSYCNVEFKNTPILYQERVRPGQAQMICSSFSPGGVFLVTGSADHHVRVYYMKGEEGPHRILEMELHGDRVDSIQWAHSGLKFLSGSKDGTAIVWWFEKQQWKSTLLDMSTKLTGTNVPDSDKKLKVTMVAWNASDQKVAVAVSDFTLKIWTATGILEKVLLGHTDEVYVLEPHPYHENIMLSAGHDGQVFIWDIYKGDKVFKYLNTIEGHGFGAIFDVKWNPDGTIFAASDSHGHIITFGFGSGNSALKNLPVELFFHTDYRPLVLDDNHWVLDEQTQMQPHQMPPPFLVDIDGNPYPPMLQRLVPGREFCNVEQLVPNILIGEEGAQEIIQEIPPPPANLEDDEEDFFGGGSPRRQGIRSRDTERIRQSTGDWQSDPTFEWKKNVVVRSLSRAALEKAIRYREAMKDNEIDEYQRQLRQRPHMISISTLNTAKRKDDKKGKRKNGKYVTRSTCVRYELKDDITESSEDANFTDSSGSSDWMEEQGRNRNKKRSKRKRRLDTAESNEDDEEEDDDEDDFEAQVDEALQSSESDNGDLESDVEVERSSRNSRKKEQNLRKRNEIREEVVQEPKAGTSATKTATVRLEDCMPSTSGYTPNSKFKSLEQYRPCEWLAETRPRKSPYYPQMGDEIVYFVQGHQLYLNAVQMKNLYEINYKDMPWNKCKIKDHVLVRVIGIQYEIKPPRLCCLKLSLLDDDGRLIGKDFTVKYHDMPDVLDFFVLKHMYDAALSRDWEEGDSFRCMIEDEWWIGKIIDKSPACQNYPDSSFLLYEIEWYNGERERMSPWDMEPIDPRRMPEEESQSVPVLHQEEIAILYKSMPGDWPENGREEVTEIIVAGLTEVMGLAIAEPFLVPVDINVYPSYAYVIEYPIDLSTIKSRFENNFYRRLTAAQFDVRYLAKNAEKFNQRHSSIVKHARIVTELCLRIIKECTVCLDVQSVYHQLMNTYNSTDSEEDGLSGSRNIRPMAKQKGIKNSSDWKAQAKVLINNMLEMEDSIPFRTPVNTLRYPDYLNIVANPMDLGTVHGKLTNGLYESPEDFAQDMRLIFQNSRTYNTNKRSRIYVMTVRLSANFEEHITAILKDWEDYKHKPRVKSKREGNNNNNFKVKLSSSESSDEDEPVDVEASADSEESDNMPLNILCSRNNTESDSTNPSNSNKEKRIVNTKRVRVSDSEEEYSPGKQRKAYLSSSEEDSSKNNDSDDDDEDNDDDDDGCSKNLRRRPVKKKTLLYESSDSETNSSNRNNKRRKKESESDTSSWSSHQNSNGERSFMSRVSSRGRVRKLTERAKAMFK